MSEEVGENIPISLAFADVSVKIGGQQILQRVNGKVYPGEMLAVMGLSGSGKTTLLNVLSGRLLPEGGEILVNGAKLNKKLQRKIGYVLQEDIFFSHLTLRETLTFSAMLRLPDTLSKDEKLQKVDEIVDNLDIRKCVETKIGGPFDRGLSGGEKKRASIGSELITNPSLIFLDEPTSGLDSSNALNLVSTLKKFAAREKKTVVASIHQPSSQIFHMFDKLLLLCGGQVAYYGKASRVLGFFESIGLVCDAHFNPADFILEKLTEGDEVQDMIVKGWVTRKKRRQKSATASYENEVPTLEAISLSPENRGPDGEQTVNESYEFAWKEGRVKRNFEVEHRGSETDSSSEIVDNDESEDISRFDSRNELKPEHELTDIIPNGSPPSEANEGSRPLIAPPKPFSSILPLRSRSRTLSKSSNTNPTSPVHTAVRLSSADFNVAVVAYKRSTSQDYTKIDVHDHDDDEDESALYGDVSTSWATSFWTQFSVLMVRTFKQTKSDILFMLGFVQNVLIALMTGLIWFQVPYKEESIPDRYALIFLILLHWNIHLLIHSLPSFSQERAVVNKERAAGYYRLSAYYLAKAFSDLLLVICQPTLFFIIVYWMTGLNKSEAFFTMLCCFLLTAIVGQSAGLLIGATVMDLKKAYVLAILYIFGTMMSGGFFQKHIPSWLSWFKYLSCMTYSYEAALTIEFATSHSFSCSEVHSAYAVCSNNGTVIQGRHVLEKLNVSRTVGENVAVLLLMIFVFRVLTYLSLRFLNRP